MNEPITLSFDVRCPVERTFRLWTSDIAQWWPRDHTVTGMADSQVFLEEGVGGRIYERGSDGLEYDWGEVTIWDPPNRLCYLWHLGVGRDCATLVDIRFKPVGSATRIEIEHSGWQRLAIVAPEARRRNVLGWETLLPHFVKAIEEGIAQ